MGKSKAEEQGFAQSGVNASRASDTFGTLSPIYKNLASGTAGLTQEQKSNMLTSGAQSVGGSVAGATGQAGLAGMRTGNIGASQAVLDDLASSGIDKNADIALGVENNDATIARQNQQEGLAGLSNLYGTASGAQTANLSTAAQAEAQRRAATMGLIGSAMGAAGTFGAARYGK